MNKLIRGQKIGSTFAVVIWHGHFMTNPRERACSFHLYDWGDDGIGERIDTGNLAGSISETKANEAFDAFRFDDEEAGNE